ncbi:MAG: ABC transporter substrate-binding protein [Gemmatimonadetes bacterium]|nr:ABC transporter substrate-binding protein [Gemmatimonadota bacterium]
MNDLKDTLRRTARALAPPAPVCLAMFICIELFAWLTYELADADQVVLEDLAQITPPERHPTEAAALHSIAEWPADRDRSEFRQAPMFDTAVLNGGLPPVAERLPDNPLVMTPPHQFGPYGGTWTRMATGPSDIGVIGARLAYDGLVRWDPMGTEVLPNLATHWEIGEEGRTYTFFLRKGVRWSDGHPFTADDIVFWYEDVLKNEELTPAIDMQYMHEGQMLGLEKIDDHTILFRFVEPNGLFLKFLASNLSYQMVEFPAHFLKNFHPRYVSEKVLQQQQRERGMDFWHQVFKDVKEWRTPETPRLWAWTCTEPPPARPAVFTRNPYYWKVDAEGRQLPYIDRITFDIYDIETINLKAINGEMNMQSRHINLPNYPLFMSNQKAGGYSVYHWIDGGDGTMALTLNLNHKDPVLREIFQDRRFRIALSYAMNRDAINHANFFGLGDPRQVAPPPQSAWYNEAYLKAYTEYDTVKANQLLDEMGLTERNEDGIRLRPDGEPLVINLESTSTQSAMARLFEMTASHWTAVGVKTKVKMTARQLYRERRNARLCDVHVWGGAGEIIPVLDPRWFMPYSVSSFQGLDYAQWYRTGGRKGTIPPEPMLKCLDLFAQISRTMDEKKQIELFHQIIDINREELYVIGAVGGIPITFIVADNFKNVPHVAVGCWPLRTPGATAPEVYAIEERGGA